MSTVRTKRPRISPQQFNGTQTPRASSTYDLFKSVSSLDRASPGPLVNTDYCLFGGLDTPGTWSEQRLERTDELDAERDYRHNRYTQRPQEPSRRYKDAMLPHNSRRRQASLQQSSTGQNRWHIRKAAWALTGGLAGKIFNFCWATTFGGFGAGGGQAYTNYAEAVTKSSPHGQEGGSLRKRTHIPGSYPDARDSIDGKEPQSDDPFRSSRMPMVYGRHTPEDSATKNSWVLVEHGQSSDHDQSPVRKKSRASVAGSASHEVAQTFQASQSFTASFASPRRTTSTASIHTRPHSAGKRPRASLASPNRRQSSLVVNQQSPVSPEIESYQRKKRKEGKRQDESLRRLNAQLQDMIREGQQALGSKIEIVDDDNMDEGYFDDDVR